MDPLDLVATYGHQNSKTLDDMVRRACEIEKENALVDYGFGQVDEDETYERARQTVEYVVFPFSIETIRTVLLEKGHTLSAWAEQCDTDMWPALSDDQRMAWMDEYHELTCELEGEAAASAHFRFEGDCSVVCQVSPISGLRLKAIERYRGADADFYIVPSHEHS